ncbi:hypothetical protein AAC03nite_38480 [Alicyclobacillus acidoterrestris]|nr:hypothetical protein AAC03nite_38480 [Alicyclobacillus acidoterrestris]
MIEELLKQRDVLAHLVGMVVLLSIGEHLNMPIGNAARALVIEAHLCSNGTPDHASH